MSDSLDLTRALLRRVAADDISAATELLALYHKRLRKMIAVRLDPRLAARVDPSDVVQETLVVAARELKNYAHAQPVAFYPWLRAIAMNRLIDLHRQHVLAKRRSVRREESMRPLNVTDHTHAELAKRLVASGASPSRQCERRESLMNLQAALLRLDDEDREILVLKYLEELPAAEISAILEVNERTVWRRHSRAIQRLSDILNSQ